MDAGLLLLLVIAVVLTGIVLVRTPDRLLPALRIAGNYGKTLAFRLPLLFFAATFLAQLVPPELVGPLISAESGWRGVLIAALVGGLLPGGATVAFPTALFLWQLGAGPAQMTVLLASWSIFALHRVIAYEFPMLGGRFVALRLAASWYLPLLAGAIALLVFG